MLSHRTFLQDSNPLVRNCHSQPIVESTPTFLYGSTKTRHSWNVFSNCDGPRIQLMNHVIGKHQVYQCISICIEPKVLIIIPWESMPHAVSVIKHGCHSVKPESIKFELLHVPSKVREQKPENFVAERQKISIKLTGFKRGTKIA